MFAWEPHRVIFGMEQARLNGCSIIKGFAVDKVEVMDREGEIHHFVTENEAEIFCEEQR